MVWDKLVRPVTITIDNKNKKTDRGVLIWDIPTRLFHWLLVICIGGSWITAEAGFDWRELHIQLGYCTLGLVLFRILWGFLGNEYARFSRFLKSPLTVVKSFPHLFDEISGRSAGHSAYGGYAVIFLLYFALAQAVSGLFVSDDILYSGPYNPAVSSDLAGTFAWYHHLNFTMLQVMVAIHILAIAWYRIRKGESLVLPMITGKKMSDQFQGATPGSPIKTAVIIAVSIAAIVLLVQLAPEPDLSYF